ncbi:MFS transporter [Caballeronia temeraria]|nr:MFS transporter [Caballeronia temeraria]
MLYYTYWFPTKYRARVVGFTMLAIPCANFFGAPVSTGIMSVLNGTHGLEGWRWLFIVEGFPAVVGGILTLLFLVDSPAKCTWLDDTQKSWLQSKLATEQATAQQHGAGGWITAVCDPKILCLVAMFALNGLATYGVNFWLPQLVKTFALTTMQTGLVAAIPFFFAGIAVVLWGMHSDRAKERVWHYAIAGWLSALGLFAAGFLLNHPVLTMIALTFAVIGVNACQPAFWTMTGMVLSTTTASAVGFAFVSSVGNLTGYVGPVLVGWLKQTTGGFGAALLVLGCTTVLMGALPLTLRRFIANQETGNPRQRDAEPSVQRNLPVSQP